MTPSIVSGAYLRSILLREGFQDSAVKISDGTYNLPTQDYIEGAFSRWFKSHLDREGLVYTPEAFDCEDFSFEAFSAIRSANRITQLNREHDAKTGITFGVLWLPTRQHSINFSVHRNKDGHGYVCAYEPQPGVVLGVCFKPFSLTAADKAAANLVLI